MQRRHNLREHCIMYFMILGNDVSEHQGVIDWNTYKNNTNFAILRATVGTARLDNQFIKNRDTARAANIPLGFYHYSYPQYNTPQAEADFFKNAVSDIREGEILVLDFEEQWSGNTVDFCKRFLDRLSGSLNGYKPLIYLNQSQTTSLNWKPVVDAGYGLWIAAYTYDPNKNTFQIGAWPFAAMQQWSNKQIVPGISGGVDANVFFGDVSTFKRYGYKKPQAQPDPRDKQIADLTAQVAQLTSQLQTSSDTIKQLQGKIDKAKTDLG